MKKILTASASIVAIMCAGAAMAQTAQGPSTGTADDPSVDRGAIQEIVVTAQKRAENVQKVPATITAVAADALKRQGVNEITDLTKVAPEVSVSQGSFQSVTIRGIRTGAFSPTNESPNAVHIDGIYLARFTALRGLFFDIDRVEVLAGPQGTLYGRNSAGGTINILSTRPKFEFGGQGSVEVGNYGTIISSASLNVPLGDTLAVRVSAYQNYNRGYNNNGTDDTDNKAFRVSALWKPTSRDTLLVTADAEKIGGKGPSSGTISQVYKQPSIGSCVPMPQMGVMCQPGAIALVPAGTPGSVVVPYNTGGRRDTKTLYGDEGLDDRNVRSGGVMVEYDHQFDWATLTAQFGYRDNFQHDRGGSILINQDPRLITAGATAPTQGGLGGFTPQPTFLDESDKTNSEEIRLASPTNQALTWLVGVFRFQEHGYDIANGARLVSFPNMTGTIGQVVVDPTILASVIGNNSNRDIAYAAFGQATFTPAGFDRLHLTGGVRYNHEHKHGIGYNIVNGAQTSSFDLSDTFTATTYKLNASFDITDHNLIYIDHSTGFKAGGFGYGASPEYRPERIKSYEIGIKNRFFDNHLQLNASAWHYDYRNYVTTVLNFFFDPGPPPRIGAQINSTNAANAKIDGQSIMGDVVITPHDRLSFDVTHLHTKFEDFDLSAGYQPVLALGFILPGATPATFNYNGTPIGNSPKFAGNATYDHSFDVAGGILDLQGAAHYVGRRLLTNQSAFADTNGYYVAKGYTTFDASLRYEPTNGRWSITLYGRNLTQNGALQMRTYVSNATYLPAADPRVTYAYELKTYGPPRTFGAIFGARF